MKRDKIELYFNRYYPKIRAVVLSFYPNRCMRCSKEPGTHGVDIHVDHIKPRSVYLISSMDIRNLQILCRYCNMQKSAEHQTDYRDDEDRLDIEELYYSVEYEWVRAINRRFQKKVKKYYMESRSKMHRRDREEIEKRDKARRNQIQMNTRERDKYEVRGRPIIEKPFRPGTILRKKT